MALKRNHPTLHSQVKNWFDAAIASNFEDIIVSVDRRVEQGHHRTEKRVVWAVPLSEFGGLYHQEQWLGLQSIVMVERTRHLWNKVTHEVQFYLSSLPCRRSESGQSDSHPLGARKAVRPRGG